MRKTFSLHISIAPIIALFIGGVITNITGYPVWSYVLWGLAIIWLIASLIYSYLHRRKGSRSPSNWIERHRIQYGKYPKLPKYLQPLVNNYTGGELSKDIEPIAPSGQIWNRMLHSQKKEWEELVRWLGKDPQDLIDLMKMALPEPQSGSKHNPFEQH